MSEDLWPVDLDTPPEHNNFPINLVREQAEFLGKHTDGIVVGSLDIIQSGNGKFRYAFNLVVPELRYSFCLFVLEYGIDGFPIVIDLDERVAEELRVAEIRDADRNLEVGHPILVEDNDELVAYLRDIFGATKTKSIIRILIAQAREESQQYRAS